ncbi:lectin BRA-3-like isoform X2 [Mytilus trossulus]|uniref:lectin BRA-3-like isoform X2 n=1 Tax=Mytilus trossulus TaxID=6551 RepID=UPI003006A57F
MMKFCCSIVVIIFTVDVSLGGILSGQCKSTNGTCGQRGYSCDATFGDGWKQYGVCCNERPCCKLPCVSETCPVRFRLLPSQITSTNCYYYGTGKFWVDARSSCAGTPGAYLWRPNTEQEAAAVTNEFNIRNVWSGANDFDEDGLYTFDTENSSFAFNALPFGIGAQDSSYKCVVIDLEDGIWNWSTYNCASVLARYICEYPRRVCP